MFEQDENRKHSPAAVRESVGVIVLMILAVGGAEAQDLPLAAPPVPPRIPAIPLGRFSSGLSFSPTTNGAVGGELIGSTASSEGKQSDGARRITLEQVKQQRSVDPVSSPLARLGQLSIEAAKQHRLGVQADYFPKIGATFANLHYSEFLGQVVTVRRPILTQVPVPLFSQNQTIAAITFVQPITPLFQVNQAVRIARADERIAMAKAGVPTAGNTRDLEIEETYFKLLIAQRRLTSAEFKFRTTQNRPLYLTASVELIHASGQKPESSETWKALVIAAAEVKELTASLNRIMGWPDGTELELVTPVPLVENISLQDVADKSPAPSFDVIEAEQTLVKARAAYTLSKLAYVPTVAAVGGYLFQNAIPLVPSNFGYGGVMASYNLFDFGKRERAVKEARAQLGMAEIALQLTRAKIATNVKKSYFELERTRQLSRVTQKMGSSVALLMNVSSTSESMEVKAARAEVEVELLEADLAHRQAFARLKALMGSQR
jgi:outer membrane protein